MKKSFSLMLAWRYLNPRRAWISSITMISVSGVLLGVLVLVVVMAVYAGMEQEQKKRLLGFSPHILLQQVGHGEQTAPIQDWASTIDSLTSVPNIVTAYPHIEDNAVVDSMTFQRPITYQAVETQDAKQVDGITKILDLTNFPTSTADMGLDARVVVSSLIAEQFAWKVGDKINLYSTRNFEQVFDAYKSTEQPIVRERFSNEISAIRDLLGKQWMEDANGYLMKREQMDVLNALYAISSADSLRSSEASAINNAWIVVAEAEHDTTNDTFRFAAGSKEQFQQALRPILEDEQDKLDSEALKELKDVVLPREAEIVGVFQSSMMLKMPDIFMPLSLAQGLSGLGDGVQGIALKVDDPYRLANVLPSLLENLPAGWYLTTWEEQFESFFNIINQQRVMMYFVLSFIILISSFSMMAVMFTVTIQKKREIGVMKALGATPGQILGVFVYQGAILGAVGSMLGVVLGLGVIAIRGKLISSLRVFGFDPFPAKISGFDILPAVVNSSELLLIFSMGLVLCIFASFVPAWFAARSDAAKSLRNI